MSGTQASKDYPVVSLFSGGMGMDIGMGLAGLSTCVAQDADRWCAETIRKNGHRVVEGDIRALIGADPECDFLRRAAGLATGEAFAVVGGPPCQAYSTAGRRRGTLDERGTLYEQFAHVVKKLRPRFFVMENVRGLLSMRSQRPGEPERPLVEAVEALFAEAGYVTVRGLLDAVNYGAAEFRERVIIIGSRDGEAAFLPEPSRFMRHQDPGLRWRVLGDAIADLEGRPMRAAAFSPAIARHIAQVPEGGNWRSLPDAVAREAMGGAYESGGGKSGFFRRLSYSEPSPTLVTSPTQKATLLCHPRENRPLSVEEYARIQGFPDDWHIEGNIRECYRQIGNAVSVPLSRAIGQTLVAIAEGSATVRTRRTRNRH